MRLRAPSELKERVRTALAAGLTERQASQRLRLSLPMVQALAMEDPPDLAWSARVLLHGEQAMERLYASDLLNSSGIGFTDQADMLGITRRDLYQLRCRWRKELKGVKEDDSTFPYHWRGRSRKAPTRRPHYR